MIAAKLTRKLRAELGDRRAGGAGSIARAHRIDAERAAGQALIDQPGRQRVGGEKRHERIRRVVGTRPRISRSAGQITTRRMPRAARMPRAGSIGAVEEAEGVEQALLVAVIGRADDRMRRCKAAMWLPRSIGAMRRSGGRPARSAKAAGCRQGWRSPGRRTGGGRRRSGQSATSAATARPEPAIASSPTTPSAGNDAGSARRGSATPQRAARRCRARRAGSRGGRRGSAPASPAGRSPRKAA